MEPAENVSKSASKSTKKRKSSNLWLHKPKKSKISKICQTETPCSNDSTSILTPPSRIQLSSNKKAPLKAKRKLKKSKRKLYGEDKNDKIINEMKEILPSVLQKLSKAGMFGDFCSFLRLIHLEKLPLTNISLLLFLDVVRWYSLDSTANMQYSSECLKFWKVMYRLFHGKALRFMGGLRAAAKENEVQIDGRGGYDPATSSINFAVPSHKSLAQFGGTAAELPNEIPPGIISQSLDIKPTDKSYVLSFDGKKLAPGLNLQWGDQDLFGHEEIESLNESKKRVDDETKYVDETVQIWACLQDTEKMERLQHILKVLSMRLKDLRHLVLKQEFALKKFLKEGGPDWRKSKFVYAISSVQAQLFQLRSSIKKVLDVNNALLGLGASINGTTDVYKDALSVDLLSQKIIITLKEIEDLSEHMANDLRFIKQRSSQWAEVRKEFRLTGSTLHEGLGLDSLKQQQRHILTKLFEK